jgi:hypothetical protein
MLASEVGMFLRVDIVQVKEEEVVFESRRQIVEPYVLHADRARARRSCRRRSC